MSSVHSLVLPVVLGLLLVSTVVAQDKSPKPIERAQLGKTKNVHKAGDQLYFAGQFTPEDIELLKKQKFKRIITLRTDGEINWDEKKAVVDAGFEYIEVPFRGPDTLTDPVFDRIRELLKDDSDKTLFHCGSANRVGGVWIPFRVLDEGVDVETAVKEAKEIGLRNPGYQTKAIEYIKRNQSEQEESVKPGINDSFMDPDMNVDDYLRLFEVESREVYFNRNEIVAAANVSAGDFVADVGAGTGLFSRLFAKAAGDDGWVYAIDISPKFVDHIRAESGKAGIRNITSVLCPDRQIGLPPNSVDVVFICDTYHHFEYPKSVLASIHRALKPGGHLILVDFERIPGKTREWLMNHVRGGKDVFRSEVQDAGFTLAEEKKVSGLQENYFLKFRKSER